MSDEIKKFQEVAIPITFGDDNCDIDVAFWVGEYEDNSLCIQLISFTEDEDFEDGGYLEEFDDVTKHIPGESQYCPDNCAFINERNLNDIKINIIDWLTRNHFGEGTGNKALSGMCSYPEFKFNMNEVRKHSIN